MKKITTALLLIFSFLFAQADHNAGGKVSWRCIKSGTNKGKFVFTVHLYRFCTGIPLFGSASLTSTSPAGTISLTRVSQRDISPGCYLGQQINCNGGPPAEDYAIEEHVYESVPITIAGVPPAAGWSFQWNSCCRPAPAIYNAGFLVDNLHPQNQSYRIQAIMYPYNNQNTSTCYDSSPTFAETPATIICTNFQFTYNHNAEDEENDSLAFVWAQPLLSNGSPVTYATHTNTSQVTPRANGGNFIVPAPGFSSTVPLPWSHPNMNVNNVPATLDPVTGEITFLSYTPGSYATAIRADAYKCGIRVASIYIDIPVFLISCAPLPPPFPPGTFNTPPSVSLTYKGNSTSNLNVSVLAGEYVEFEVASTDFEFLPGFVQQTNSMAPSSSQFGNNYSDTVNGCAQPPCAIMDTNSTPPLGYYDPVNNNWSGVSGLRSDFKWRTDCNHLAKAVTNCFVRSNVYTFIFKILDDYCPAPGANFVTASVTVNAPDPIDPPKLKCVTVLANGDVELSWSLPLDPALDSNNSFRKYVLYRTSKRDTADYTPIDTFLNPLTLSYTDVGANAHITPKFYFIMGISSCNDQARQVDSDTIAGMKLTATAIAGGDSVDLKWTPFVLGNVFPATTIAEYNVWQVVNNDTTLATTTATNELKMPIFLCYPTDVTYYVTVVDTTAIYGCTSYSNPDSVTVGDNSPPTAPSLKFATIENNGDVSMGWSPSIDPDAFVYYIYENGVKIDSVYAPDTNFIKSFGSNVGILPTTYALGVADSCGNESSVGFISTTMMDSIDGQSINRCANDRRIAIDFTEYIGWSVQKYYVYADTGGGFYAIDSIDPVGISFPYKYTLDRTKFSADTNNYVFQVRARDANGTFVQSSVDTILMYTVADTVVGPPTLTCVSYLPNGDIRINWNRPTNPENNFDSYQIYSSSNGSSFTPLDSIISSTRSGNDAWDSTGYTFTNPSPNQDYYFRVYSRSGCDGFELSAPSNTIQALRISTTRVQSNVNQLNWSYIVSPSTLGNYSLFRDYPIGTGFAPYSGAPQSANQYNDTFNVCLDSVKYRLQIEDNGCISVSNVITGIFRDDVPPAKTFLDSISVINDTNAILGWRDLNPSDAITEYYLIKRTNTGAFEILDTISGNSREHVVFQNSGCMALVPADSCFNNRFSIGDFDYHCTMHTSIEVDRCDESFTIKWNAYETFKTGSNVLYEVFASTNGTNFSSIGTTSEEFLRFKEPVSGNDYCFFVRATESGGNGSFTSTSDSVCVSSEFLVAPEYAYMQHVTVRDSGEIKLSVWVDVNADIEEYNIHRGIDSSIMKQIATVSKPDIQTPSDRFLEYIDESADTDLKSFYYQVGIVDPCGEEVMLSNFGKNILLKVEADNQAKKNVLTWTGYEDWESGVLDYAVYRRLEGNEAKFIETVRNGAVTYEDDVSDLVEESQGLFCYYVVANEATPLFPGLEEPETSRSNEYCVIQYPLFYIPTSFTPGDGNSPGLNDIFKPEGVFIDYDSYSFEIYNRWGEKLFATDNFSTGWDGTFNGKPVELGAYVYLIKYKGADGRDFEHQGTVTISR